MLYINQERGRCRIQEARDAAQGRSTGNARLGVKGDPLIQG